jgi:hypothetical protein
MVLLMTVVEVVLEQQRLLLVHQWFWLEVVEVVLEIDRKSTRLNSSHADYLT